MLWSCFGPITLFVRVVYKFLGELQSHFSVILWGSYPLFFLLNILMRSSPARSTKKNILAVLGFITHGNVLDLLIKSFPMLWLHLLSWLLSASKF